MGGLIQAEDTAVTFQQLRERGGMQLPDEFTVRAAESDLYWLGEHQLRELERRVDIIVSSIIDQGYFAEWYFDERIRCKVWHFKRQKAICDT